MKTKIYVFITIITINSLQKVYSQSSDLIKTVSTSYAELNSNQQELYDKLSQIGNVDAMYFVSVGTLNDSAYADSIYGGSVVIDLSFLKCNKLRFQAAYVNYTSEDDYQWFGNFIDSSLVGVDTIKDTISDVCTSGSLTLISINGAKSGNLSIENDNYIIADLSGGLQVMIKKERNAGCVFKEEEVEVGTYQRSSDACVDHTLRILIFYTPAALGTGLNPTNVASASVTEMLGDWGNSYIYPTAPVVIAGVLSYSYTEQSGDIDGDWTHFAQDPNVISARASYHADLCVLFTKGNYYYFNEFLYYIFGRAHIGPLPFDSAYAIIEIDHSHITFPHEVGHLFGARHDLNTNGCGGDCYDYAHGKNIYGAFNYLYWDFHYYATIMASPNHSNSHFGEPTIPYFSTPFVSYLGSYPTGTSGSEDNALKLRTNMHRIEDYYTEVIPGANARFHIGNPEICDQYITGIVDNQCGTPPYTYQWYRSNNGITYYPIPGAASSSANLHTNPSATIGHYEYIKVVIHDFSGASVNKYSSFYVPMCCPHCNPHYRLGTYMHDNSVIDFSLFPNPASNQITLTCTLNEAQKINYEIFNLLGENILSRKDIVLNKDFASTAIDTKTLPAGFYYLKIISSNNNSVLPFVVNH